jgi:hypothetical protein
MKIWHMVCYGFQKTQKYLHCRGISTVFILYVETSVLSLLSQIFHILTHGLVEVHYQYPKYFMDVLNYLFISVFSYRAIFCTFFLYLLLFFVAREVQMREVLLVVCDNLRALGLLNAAP